MSLSVTATDNGTVSSRQYSVDGGTTWLSANAAVTLSAEGTTTVRYRATDSGGNVSETGSLTVRIDRTAPAVTVTGLDADGAYGDSQRPKPVVTTADPVSGVATTTTTLDGAAITPGQPLDLWRLPLGGHELTVKAVDRAGNTTTKTVRFTTRASFDDLATLLPRLTAEKLVTAQGEQRLTVRLGQARAHADAGRLSQARAVLDSFATAAGDPALVPDAAAGAALARDARAVKGGLTG
ncbi:OmpL47-type beta-barrel domain-containing protein [Streptomyces sp. NPDC096310]|uniref:OmpL47-type beta-barrel domain-containing protein n=1 Tax=Streptomyces sp. NPDC096310 TaxID=3366082 RepID=UPI003808F5B4